MSFISDPYNYSFTLGAFLSPDLSENMIIYSLQRERLVNLYLFLHSIRDHLKYVGTSMVYVKWRF